MKSGTWLYLGKQKVLGGTGSSPKGDARERNSLQGLKVDQSTLQFVEVDWDHEDNGQAYPKHNESYRKYHESFYDLGNGKVETHFSSFLHYEATLTFRKLDGTLYTKKAMYTVRQMTNGDTFVTPSGDYGATHEEFADPLLSVTLGKTTAGSWNYVLPGVRDFTPNGEEPPKIVTCFVSGTMIECKDGPRRIDDIRVGDLIMTKDNGLQPVRWVGSRRLGTAELAAAPHLKPIQIAAGALGPNQPATDLMVSPQHRVLLQSGIAREVFGSDQVLAAAKQLLAVDGVTQAADLTEVRYFHMLFDQHEIVFSNGLETESLYTGPMALKSLAGAALAEIFELFPAMAESTYQPKPARKILSGREVRDLTKWHLKEGRQLIAA